MSLPNRSNASSFDATNKINDQNCPPANDQLQWDNPSLARGICDVAALGLVSPRFTCRLQLAGSTAAMVLLSSYANWTNVSPGGILLARTATGVFTITLPTMVSNEYDASFNITNNIVVNLIQAVATFETAVAFINASASGNVITLNTFNQSGSSNDLVDHIVSVVAF